MSEHDRAIIRRATAADAEALAAMLDAMNVEDGQPPGRFDAARVRRDGFGDDPAFSALVASVAGRSVGYALFLPFYNTELARRGLWMLDLWIAPQHRRRGLGRHLVAALAARTVDEGRASLWWTVRNSNAAARAFYAALGAKDDETRLLELDGTALEALAGAAD
jgi:ribosomal protein S18 acetylase RimI-like enzyme